MKTKILSVPLLLFMTAMTAGAQTTINMAGGSAVVGSNRFDWSVGEMALVSTFSGSAIVVTQGVLQPAAGGITGIAGAAQTVQRVQVFPNPASSHVNIRYTSPAGASLAYNLFDATGKSVRKEQVSVQPGITQLQLDIANLACADYFLEVIINEGNTTTEKIPFKIQKLN